MPRKQVGQLGFEDARGSLRRGRRPERLEAMGRLIDWAALAGVLAPVDQVSAKGEAAWPALVLFKALILQRWHDLSDEGLEAALFDRLSFQAFCGLSLEDDVPDHATLWRFRQKLSQAGLMEALFAELERQFDAQGMVVRQGTLIDASLLEAAARRPTKKQGKTSRVDPDARFGSGNQRGRYTFGYKAHVAVDEGSLLVRAVRVTPANVQEIEVACDLVRGDEKAVLADRGYDAKRLRDHLERHGIDNLVMRRGGYRRPVTAEDVLRNHAIAPRRRVVESVFGTLKRIYRMDRLRYFTMARNATSLSLAFIAYNIRRCLSLAAAA